MYKTLDLCLMITEGSLNGTTIRLFIMLTCLCNVDPITSQFYIVKLGFTGVYIFSLIFAQNIDRGVC